MMKKFRGFLHHFDVIFVYSSKSRNFFSFYSGGYIVVLFFLFFILIRTLKKQILFWLELLLIFYIY